MDLPIEIQIIAYIDGVEVWESTHATTDDVAEQFDEINKELEHNKKILLEKGTL